MPERGGTAITGGVEPGDMIDSMILSGTSRSIVDAMMTRLPARFQTHEEAQVVIEQMRQAEQRYLPLVNDLQQSSMGNDLQRHLPRMMLSLFGIGLIACMSLVFGVIAFLIAAIVFIVYGVVRWRVIREMRAEARRVRDDLIKYGTRLIVLEKRLLEQERTA